MMKRTLSFLLCLVMVLGLAALSVQASGTDNVYTSSDIMDNIVIDGDSNVDIVFEDNSISASQVTEFPDPADLVTEPTTPSASVVEGGQCVATAKRYCGA